MFQLMIDFTEPLCQTIDSSLASILAFDTSGIRIYACKSTPKTLNFFIGHLISHYKNTSDMNPFFILIAYKFVPIQSLCNPATFI